MKAGHDHNPAFFHEEAFSTTAYCKGAKAISSYVSASGSQTTGNITASSAGPL